METRTSDPRTTPIRLHLMKTERLEIDWQDGGSGVYPLSMLRARCPCAKCKTVRAEQTGKKKSLLNILPGNYAGQLSVTSAEKVGNYALRLSWSDQHDSGIYSFEFLRELADQASRDDLQE